MSSESRIWEIRPFGSMRGGRELVIGPVPFNPSSPAYSTERRFSPCYLCFLLLGIFAFSAFAIFASGDWQWITHGRRVAQRSFSTNRLRSYFLTVCNGDPRFARLANRRCLRTSEADR